MKTNNEAGRNISICIGAYLIVKFILNLILGGFNIGDLIIAVLICAVMLFGLKYTNYAAAAVLALIAIYHLPGNISNIGSNWIYLIEGIIDIVCAVLLCVHRDVRGHFTNEWNEIGK